MKLTKLYMLPAMLLLVAAGGCSDSDDWTPGPQDTDTGVSAYFPVPSKTSYIFDSDSDPADMTILVNVSRNITEGSISIPVTISSDAEGFSAPSTVDFSDGAADASFTISCSGIPKGTTVNVTATLDPSQTNTYGIGMDAVTYSVIKADWLEVSDNVTYYYMDSGSTERYPSTTGSLYMLEGTHTFKFNDFFGSGLDITFNWNGDPTGEVLVPQTNADFENVYDEDKELNGWYLYDEAEQDWPSWTPGGASDEPAITYLLFYASGGYSDIYFGTDSDPLSCSILSTVGVDLENGSFYWGFYNLYFTLKYNPFE